MLSQEWQFQKDYSDLIADYRKSFPGVDPPDPQWFFHWAEKYPTSAIKDAIHTLAKHSLKASFSAESCGRAISSLLRTDALKRALAKVQTPTGGTR
jgi:hypothetical protein